LGLCSLLLLLLLLLVVLVLLLGLLLLIACSHMMPAPQQHIQACYSVWHSTCCSRAVLHHQWCTHAYQQGVDMLQIAN
jgi:hypothetical protein